MKIYRVCAYVYDALYIYICIQINKYKYPNSYIYKIFNSTKKFYQWNYIISMKIV